jgi:GNAT superfamily N-acetyltransferase
MSETTVREVRPSDAGALKSFVALERQWIGSNALFVSEIDADLIKGLSGRSEFFSEMEHTLFVASNGGRDVARCAALINRKYQKAKKEPVGFIGYFAAAPGEELAVRALFERSEAWLKDRGVDRIIAPFNGAASLGAGVRSAAYDEEPMFPFGWQPPYYTEYLVALGYKPAYPLWYYTVDFRSEKYRAAKHRASENKKVLVRPVNKKLWNQELETFRVLFNESFQDEWEFHPLTNGEFHEFLDPMKPVLDPRQMLVGEVGGEPAGFCLGMPDWSPLFRSFQGKLGLVQIVRLMLGAKRYRRAGLLGIGALPAYRGTGLAQCLAIALYSRYEERGLKEAFYYPVNEDNARSRNFAESLGGTGRVLAHCYDKRLQ